MFCSTPKEQQQQQRGGFVRMEQRVLFLGGEEMFGLKYTAQRGGPCCCCCCCSTAAESCRMLGNAKSVLSGKMLFPQPRLLPLGSSSERMWGLYACVDVKEREEEKGVGEGVLPVMARSRAPFG